MERLTIKTGDPYEVLIGQGIIESAGTFISQTARPAKAAVITDDNVGPLYAETVAKSLSDAGIPTVTHTFPHGEENKNHKTLLGMYDFLAANEFSRADLVVALGGGVVGDMAGYAAATYMRGIDFVQIPTTIIAQSDSSVGGKTAVDIPAGKNLVGAFHQPRLVICDTDTLKTLPEYYFIDGMAEVVKHGMIKSEELFNILCEKDIMENIVDIMRRNVAIKGAVVANDEREKGERMLLNFGHTYGHALEKYYDFHGISHGRAVAVGMSRFTHTAEERGMCEKGTAKRLDALLRKLSLPTDDPAPIEQLLQCSLVDKKHSERSKNIVICDKAGSSRVVSMGLSEYADFFCGR